MKLTTLAFAAFALAVPGMASAQATQFTIGTNPVGTAYNAVGVALAQAITKETGTRTTAQPFTGSAVMAPLVNAGELTVGMTTTFGSGRNYRGEDGSAEMPNLRVIARLWTLPYGYIVKANSDLQSVSDLKGKRTVMEIRGSDGLYATNVALLASAGLEPEDVTQVDVASLPQGVSAVEDGTADATSVAIPIAIVQQANATISGGIRVLDINGPNATQEFLSEKAPGLTLIKASAGSMVGVKKDITIMGLETVIFTSTATTNEDIGTMLGAIEAQWPTLQEQFGFLKGVKPADFVHPASMAQPYHDGSIEWFKSKGYWSDEAQAKQDALLAK